MRSRLWSGEWRGNQQGGERGTVRCDEWTLSEEQGGRSSDGNAMQLGLVVVMATTVATTNNHTQVHEATHVQHRATMAVKTS